MKDKQAKRRLSPEATCATVTLDEWTRLLERWQHTCAYCQDDLHGRRMYDVTMDHFVPLSRGGSHDLGNIVPACRSCNSAKNNLYPQAFCGFDQIADLYEARFGAPVALPEAA